MTKINRPVRRRVLTAERFPSPLVVTLSAEGIWIRKPRKRLAYLLSYALAYQVAGDAFARAAKKAKDAARKAKRAAL